MKVEPVINEFCESCKKKIEGRAGVALFYQHAEGQAKTGRESCTEECEKERRRLKFFCEDCAEALPKLNGLTICCGHSLFAISSDLHRPGWMYRRCEDCGYEESFYDKEKWE